MVCRINFYVYSYLFKALCGSKLILGAIEKSKLSAEAVAEEAPEAEENAAADKAAEN